MLLSPRKLPEEPLHYSALKFRTAMTARNADKVHRLLSGVEGERVYDLILEEQGHENLYIFRDIYLNIEGSVTQYDTLIVFESGIVVNEIKNFNGRYEVAGDSWYASGGTVLADDAPTQLRRAMGKLIRMQRRAGLDFAVTGKLIFPNENFSLISREDKLWRQVVLRADLQDYFRSFMHEYSGEYASKIADLIERHIVPNPYFKLRVEFSSVRHGLYCGGCGSFNLDKQQFHFLCRRCGTRESNETHLVRAINDFKYLFGDTPMTTKRMLDFTGGRLNYRTILRALNKYCSPKGIGKSTHYQFKYYDFAEAMSAERSFRKYKDYLK